MNLFQLHMMWRLAFLVLAAVGVLSLAVLLINPEGLFTLFFKGGLTLGEFLYANLLLLPLILCHTAPIALAIGVTFLYHKWVGDNEILTLRNAGLSQRAIAMPGLIVAVMLMLGTAVVTLFLLPITHRSLTDLAFVAMHNLGFQALEEGRINPVAPGLELMFKDWDGHGGMIDLTIFDRRQQGHFSLVRAQSGSMTADESGAMLTLEHGNMLQWDEADHDVKPVTFDQLNIRLERDRADLSTRHKGWFERSIFELLDPPPEIRENPRVFQGWITEGHQRIITPLLCLNYVLLALGVLMWRQPRRSALTLRILFLAAAVPALHIGMVITHAAIITSPWLLPLFYFYATVPALIGGGLLFAEDFRGQRLPRQRSPREPKVWTSHLKLRASGLGIGGEGFPDVDSAQPKREIS